MAPSMHDWRADGAPAGSAALDLPACDVPILSQVASRLCRAVGSGIRSAPLMQDWRALGATAAPPVAAGVEGEDAADVVVVAAEVAAVEEAAGALVEGAAAVVVFDPLPQATRPAARMLVATIIRVRGARIRLCSTSFSSTACMTTSAFDIERPRTGM